jgi:hypothetical protein
MKSRTVLQRTARHVSKSRTPSGCSTCGRPNRSASRVPATSCGSVSMSWPKASHPDSQTEPPKPRRRRAFSTGRLRSPRCSLRIASGFNAVVGNPPWEEINVEELGFYARYQPGVRALAEEPRNEAIESLKRARPELSRRLSSIRDGLLRIRGYLQGNGRVSEPL